MRENAFPQNFVWGSATASFQVEGGACEGGRGETIWDRFTHVPGNIEHGDLAEDACGCYYRTREDVAMMKRLGLKAYRFSVCWSRIFPEGYGRIADDGVRYYSELVDELISAGIEPYVTLFHWDLPQALQDEGGWTNRQTVQHFADYAQFMFQTFSGRVRHWMTFNEPWVSSFLGYYEGTMAPGYRDFSTALQTAHGQLLAHGMAVKSFREGGFPGEIGIVLNLTPKQALTYSEADRAAADRLDGYMNRWFLDPVFKGKYPEDMQKWYTDHGIVLPKVQEEDLALISLPVDFLGINYYCIDFAKAAPHLWPLELETGMAAGNPKSHYDQPITPDGIRQILMRVTQDYAPARLYITENGLSAQDYVDRFGEVPDEARIDYMALHIEKMGEAISQGAPLAGYFYWSLFDNFEWNRGYEMQFGLVYVDRKTLKRIPKRSAYWYRDLIAANGEHAREEQK